MDGRVTRISMSPSGALWLGTAMGRAYRSDDGGRSWSEAAVLSRQVDANRFLADSLDQLTFFDERRAMFSGYIGEEQNQILLTSDAGTTWEAIALPDGGFSVYDAQATSDGHAWLVGSSGTVLRSDDFGRKWRTLAQPFDEDERTMSVWFESPRLGVVASLFGGEIAITKNGGESWEAFEARGREDVLRGCGEDGDQRITKIRMRDERVIVAQCGGVFAAPISAPRTWSRLTADGKPLVDFELADDALVVGVSDDRTIHVVAFDGTSRPFGFRLQHPPLAMAVAGKRIAILDATMKVAVFDGEAWLTSRMLGKGVATAWPISTLDRGEADVLWGVSAYFLYRSMDGAKTWDRISELPAAADRVLIQSDGNVLLSDGHGWVGRWDRNANALVEVPVLNGLDVAGAFRRSDVWLVFGGRQYDTAGRIEVAQTFFGGQFAGSVDFGFVAASVDGGRTWTIVDRWKEEGPQAIFLSDENRLTLLSWLCGVRTGTLTLNPVAATMQTVLSGEEKQRTPYVQKAMVLDLLRGQEGWIVGWIHHVGTRVHHTTDGGRSWKGADASGYPRVALYRLFDGTWIAAALPSTVERWTGKAFEKLASAPEDVTHAWVDSRGSFSLRTEDGAVHVLDPQKRSFRRTTGR